MFEPSINCINRTKSYEEFLPQPTWDKIGEVWNIGYGTTHYPDGSPVCQNDPEITEEQATEYLTYYLTKCGNAINESVTSTINQNQFDALTIFAYNVGITAFNESTLLSVINADPEDYFNIQKQWMRWIYSKGVKVQGLINRREAEFALYIS